MRRLFPLTLASPAFDGLEVRERLDWVNPGVAMAHPWPDGSAIALHRDLEATVASLEAAAPGAGRGWRAVVEPLLARRRRVLRAALTPSFPPVRDGLALAFALRRDAVDLARLALASSATFGREVMGDERAAAWLSSSVVHADLTPGAAGGGALAFGLHLLGHAVGWGFPRGGAGRLTAALVARVRELGGEVRCGAPVAAVELRGGRVTGVRLAGGEALPAGAVVLALSARPAAALLPEDALPGRLMRRLRGWRYGIGTFKVDYALAGPVPWTSEEARRAGVVHVGAPLEALFRAHQEAGAGRVPAEPVLVVGQHSLHDGSRAPAGRHTLYVYAHVPQRLDVTADEVVERIERQPRALRTRLRPPDTRAGRSHAGRSGVREPQPRRRRLGGRELRARPAAHLPPGAGAVPRPHAAPRALPGRDVRAPGRGSQRRAGRSGRPPACHRPADEVQAREVVVEVDRGRRAQRAGLERLPNRDRLATAIELMPKPLENRRLRNPLVP